MSSQRVRLCLGQAMTPDTSGSQPVCKYAKPTHRIDSTGGHATDSDAKFCQLRCCLCSDATNCKLGRLQSPDGSRLSNICPRGSLEQGGSDTAS